MELPIAKLGVEVQQVVPPRPVAFLAMVEGKSIAIFEYAQVREAVDRYENLMRQRFLRPNPYWLGAAPPDGKAPNMQVRGIQYRVPPPETKLTAAEYLTVELADGRQESVLLTAGMDSAMVSEQLMLLARRLTMRAEQVARGPLPKNCCPQCGHQFVEVAAFNTCTKPEGCGLTSKREDLIDEDSDYTFVM